MTEANQTGVEIRAVEAAGPEPEVEPVSQQELNSWRRGFTPQAEIWNGRLAMLGLSVGIGVLLLSRLASGGHS
ncbi:MAG: high light inducible protein [Cyanobium sp.]